MAIKIFCNSCQKYIRDAKPGEISSLRGIEICEECEKGYSEYIKAVQKAADRAIDKITSAAKNFQVQAEEAKKHIVKPEEEPE